MKLSIITINLNNANGLERTIKSVVEQEFDDYEYILIDGGSSDGSIDIIRQYENKFSYWVSEKDSGIYNAMNKGIKQAKGAYCLFLNSGDYLYSEKVVGNVFSIEPDAEIIYGDLLIEDNGRLTCQEYPDVLRYTYFVEDSLPHPAMFIKRCLFDKIGVYDETYNVISDWIFALLAICKFNCSYMHISECITVFNLDGISTTTPPALIGADREAILNENFSLFRQDIEELYSLRRRLARIEKKKFYRVMMALRKLLGKKAY